MALQVTPRSGLSFHRWIGATTLGWLLGLLLLVALATAWNGATGGEAQWMVGVSMGAGVGFLQARALRSWLPRPRRWLVASTVGMGIPFLLWDTGSLLGIRGVFSLPSCILLGGLLAGILQERLLRSRFPRSLLWIPTSIVAWGVPVTFVVLGQPSVHLFLTVLSIVTLFLGGLLLGSVSGKVLAWVLASHP
jgi:hypothetical protein